MKVADALGMEETALLGGINEGRSKLEEKLDIVVRERGSDNLDVHIVALRCNGVEWIEKDYLGTRI
eukprot:scaffold5055_cov210-Alexandrium_tamarense.AAC.9